MTDRAWVTASDEGVKMALMAASCSACRAALPVMPSLRLAVASLLKPRFIALEVGHVDRGDAGRGGGRDDARSRKQQVFPGAFGAEVGGQVAAAQEESAHAFVGARDEMGNEHRPRELDHREDADRRLRSIEDVRDYSDLVGGLDIWE